MKKYKNIQYLRVLACLGVIMVHFGQRIGLNGGTLYLITHFGLMGAYVFFIISGFLGFYTYRQNQTFGAYWIKRLFRILPVYYFIILYDFILHGCILHDVPADLTGLGWLRYIFCISQCVPGEDFWRNLSMTWTISIFILFYLLMPLLYKVITSYRRSWIAFFVLYGISQIMGSSCEWFTPLFYLYFFFFGVIAYFAIQEQKENITCLLMCMILIVELIFSNINSTTVSCIFTIIILISQNMAFRNHVLTSVMDIIDRYSFTIYLVQAIVMEAISMLQKYYVLSVPAVSAITILGIACISILVHHLIELPAQHFYQTHIAKKRETAS